MKRMEARGDWTLFRSNEVSICMIYTEKRLKIVIPNMKHRQNVEKSLEKKCLLLICGSDASNDFETGHPWITYKDPCNIRSPQDHAGVIHVQTYVLRLL